MRSIAQMEIAAVSGGAGMPCSPHSELVLVSLTLEFWSPVFLMSVRRR
jgi:hypothetical protein